MKAKVENRFSERSLVHIPTIVLGPVSSEESWEESTHINNLSKNSVGLTLTKKCEVGQLLFLFAQIPLEFRSDERIEEKYSVWGIIQQCTLVKEKNGAENFQVGLALIGENPPKSHFQNPFQSYRIAGIDDTGFWKIIEVNRQFVQRRYTRFWVQEEVYLAVLDDQSNTSEGEKVLTENISVGGAAVLTRLDLKVGDCIKFIAADYEFSALSVVRNIHFTQSGVKKVRLEFIAAKFPIAKL